MTSNWKEYKIADLGKIKTGKTPKTSIQENYGGNIPFLTPSDDMSVKYVKETVKKITESGLKEVKSCLLPAGSICVSCIGSDLGKVVMTTKPTVTNQQINSIIVDTEQFDTDFCYYLMVQLGELLNYHSKTSTAVPIINKTNFSSYGVHIPDLETQQKIAKVLSAIDDKIELNNSINNNLEQQIFTIFDNKFPNVRDGKNTISDYFSPKRGKNLLSKNAVLGDVPVIAGGLNPATYHNVANTKAPVITISASGANAGFVNLWHIPVWSSDSSYIDNTITSNIYFWYVMLKKRQQEIFDSQTGSAQPHIYPQHIEGMTVSDIDMNLVNDFNDNVTPLFINIGENIKENQKLIQLRDTLLPKLMNGEIDVSNVEIDDILENQSEQSSSADKLLFSED